METEQTDRIIAEVRAVRDAHAARFDYDIAAIFRDIRARQEASTRTCVRRPARRVAEDIERAADRQAPAPP